VAAVYIPTSVLAGLMILLAGPQALAEVTNGWSPIPAETVAVLSALPGLRPRRGSSTRSAPPLPPA
jgi:hypothetical protein